MIIGHGGNTVEVARGLGCRPADIADMSSNMNPLGPMPGLLEFLRERLPIITALPEADAGSAVAAFARRHHLSPQRVVAGNGSTQLIHSLPRALDTRRALIVAPAYADYADACRQSGVEINYWVADAADGFRPDLECIARNLSAVDTVFFCNPNNPSGHLISADRLESLCHAHPRVRFVIDEAYLPFTGGGSQAGMLGYSRPNVVVLNSMSKIFRVPGLRIGFAAAPAEVAMRLRALTPAWSVNSLAQAAVEYLMAPDSAGDAFIAATDRFLSREKQLLYTRLGNLDWIETFPSSTSFVLARLSRGYTAEKVFAALAADRILIRNCANFHGLSNRYIRMSLKKSRCNRRLTECLGKLEAKC